MKEKFYLEEIILAVTVQKVEVEVGHGHKAVFSNFEGHCSQAGRSTIMRDIIKLLKVYGRIQRLVQDPIVPQPEQAVITWSKYLEI